MKQAAVLGLIAALVLGGGASAAEKTCKLGKIAELPVRMTGLRPVISVEINGSPVDLILDTGAFFSSLDAPTAAKLGVTKSPLPAWLEIYGAGGAAKFELGKAKTFKFAGVNFDKVDFLVGGPSAGVTNGLLGQNVLGKLDIEYDFGNGIVRLFRAVDCASTTNLAYWAAGKPVNIVSLKPVAPSQSAYVGKAKVNNVNIDVLFDTGASTTVLDRSAAAKAGFTPNGPGVRNNGVSSGVGARGFETWTAPFESVSIGDEQITNTRMTVGDMKINSTDMLLGADYFLSHRVLVARSQNRLYSTYNGGPVFKLAPNTSTVAAGAKDGDVLPDSDAYRRRAAAAAARLNFPGALADLDKAVALDPKDPDNYYDRAMLHLRARDGRALEDLEQVLSLRPGDSKALVARGQWFLRHKQVPKARADFDQALAAAHGDVEMRLSIASAYMAADQFQDAIAGYDAWIAANPKDPQLAQFLNARCWARGLWNKELDKGMEDCNASIRLSRTSATLDSRALLYLRGGQYAKALNDYNDVLKLQPKSAISLFGRGLAQHRLGKTAEGDADVTAAAALRPDIKEWGTQYGLTP